MQERVRALAQAAGVEPEAAACDAPHTHPQQCWVDARVRCPYGNPEGQYLLRPTGFCHDTVQMGDGCMVFHDRVADSELTAAQRNDAVREYFQAQQTDVTGELRARAEELPDGSAERLALELAADIVEERKLDRNILLEEDLPE